VSPEGISDSIARQSTRKEVNNGYRTKDSGQLSCLRVSVSHEVRREKVSFYSLRLWNWKIAFGMPLRQLSLHVQGILLSHSRQLQGYWGQTEIQQQRRGQKHSRSSQIYYQCFGVEKVKFCKKYMISYLLICIIFKY